MENASKALVMAGSVLIALLIIGALLLMFNNLTNYQETNVQTAREAQIVEFNNQFVTYNRKNVRGNELYSLLNRVIDYNKRKTIEGEAGAIEIGYESMTVKFHLNTADRSKNRRNFTMDGTQRLLDSTTDDYTVSGSTNTFENRIIRRVTELEATYTEQSLTKLAAGITKIFLEDNASSSEKMEAANAFQRICKVPINNDFNRLKSGSTIREDVYTYYEYIQFKRAHFDCINIKYDNKTGRILELEFQFTGKFE